MKKIPHADITLSPVTLGTMTYGSPVAFDDAVALTRYAAARGINHIDTANMYEGYGRYAGSAGGVAEEIVGEAIRTLRREDIVIATKLGMKVGSAPEDEGTGPAAIRKQLDVSLRRLGTDYVDLYYLHRPDPDHPLAEILGALAREIAAGKIRYYGVSNYSAEQLAALLRCADAEGLPRPVICQPPLSLLKPAAAQDLLPLCEREEIAVVPYQIYQGGLLTGKYRRGSALPAGSRAAEKPEWVMQLDNALFDRLEAFTAQAEARGLTLAQYALRWALEQPAVLSVLVGVKSEAQVDAALAAAET
ncbi:MAG: aldo/keto reductase [Oscillospiraceae bacterium]|nr:aldo/keto reductase [Oscillospiraceae bacterium]